VLNAKPFDEKQPDKIPINQPVKLTKWTTDWLYHSTIHQCNSANRIGNTKMKQKQKRTVPSLQTIW
jgi:hypothetical protein